MQKLFIILCLLIGVSGGAHAQQCLNDSSMAITDSITVGTDSVPFLTPSSDSLPCLTTGWGASTYDTLYFTTFTTLHGFNVDSLTIDSINNLPPGLCWSTNSGDNTFAGGQNGAIVISGRLGAQPGQYKLVIYISATTDIVPLYNINLERDLGFRYYMRVICPGNACPAVDTTGGMDSFFIPYAQSVSCNAGINEVNNNLTNISVVPNPLTNSAVVNFNSSVEGIFTLRMTDLPGAVVFTKEINVRNGSNQTTIQRNGLSAGMYLLSISNNNGSITRKVIID